MIYAPLGNSHLIATRMLVIFFRMLHHYKIFLPLLVAPEAAWKALHCLTLPSLKKGNILRWQLQDRALRHVISIILLWCRIDEANETG